MRRYPPPARVLLAAIACVLAPALIAEAAGAGHWRVYQNDRYGTTIDYPDFFRPEPSPDANDGLRFKSSDGAKFAVFASYNTLDFDLAGFQAFTLKDLEPGQVVTYQAHGANWFVLTGTKADEVFYERHLLSHAGQMTESFVMSYPAALKPKYDPVVVRMSQSFREGTGFQTPDKPGAAQPRQ